MENNNFTENSVVEKTVTENNVIQLEMDPLLVKKMSFIATIQKVFGVLSIIAGAISCIGIISAVVGIPVIIAGVKLFKSGSCFSYALYTNDSNSLRDAILNLASYWLMYLISIIITIAFYIIMFLVMIASVGSRGYYY